MGEHPMRYYSDRQEKAIAEYLGWRVVPASGARPFDKGDITSDEYVGECKTKTAPTSRIEFRYTHFDKICTEAQAAMKRPALFTDDGTQKPDHTFVMVSRTLCNGIEERTGYIQAVRVSSTKLSFDPAALNLPAGTGFRVKFGHHDTIIMRLETFKMLISGELS